MCIDQRIHVDSSSSGSSDSDSDDEGKSAGMWAVFQILVLGSRAY